MHFTEVIFSYLNNSSRSTELSIAWAMQLLESGTDITSASELASCSLEPCPDPHQVKNLFLSCVAELGVGLPENWDSEFDAYILCMCNQLAQGALEPKQFLEKLVVLSNDFDYVCILGIWADLANELNFPSDLFICVGGVLWLL